MAHATIRPQPLVAATETPRSERASALILVPSMTLVLMCLGAIAIDLSLLHGAHRSAHRIVSAAADDAAAMIDTEELQRSGDLVIDPSRARTIVQAHLDTASLPGRPIGEARVDVDPGAATVTVTVELLVEHVMLRSVPGRAPHERMTITAAGRLNR